MPERPEDLHVTAVTKDSISVAWRPPKYDGGSEVTSYVLEARLIGKDSFARISEDKLMEKTFTYTGLKDGSSYEFRVSAVNAVGQGKASFSTKPVTCKDELGKYLLVLQSDKMPLPYFDTSISYSSFSYFLQSPHHLTLTSARK